MGQYDDIFGVTEPNRTSTRRKFLRLPVESLTTFSDLHHPSVPPLGKSGQDSSVASPGSRSRWASRCSGLELKVTMDCAGISTRRARKLPPLPPSNSRNELALRPDAHGTVVNALAGGAEQLLPSVAGPLAVAGGLALAPEGAVGLGTGMLLSAALGAAPAAMSQGQETLRTGKRGGWN